MTRVGFTGTRQGMSEGQKAELRLRLKDLEVTEFHHGDCLGADAEADAVARELGAVVIIHPPSNPSRRAFCARPGDAVWEPLPYLERNRDIVESSSVLVAAPRTDAEEARSGTWSTVRYAVRCAREVVILKR